MLLQKALSALRIAGWLIRSQLRIGGRNVLIEEGRLPRTVANLTRVLKLPGPDPNPPLAGAGRNPRYQSLPQL